MLAHSAYSLFDWAILILGYEAIKLCTKIVIWNLRSPE